jgi:hypothetical protein
MVNSPTWLTYLLLLYPIRTVVFSSTYLFTCRYLEGDAYSARCQVDIERLERGCKAISLAVQGVYQGGCEERRMLSLVKFETTQRDAHAVSAVPMTAFLGVDTVNPRGIALPHSS